MGNRDKTRKKKKQSQGAHAKKKKDATQTRDDKKEKEAPRVLKLCTAGDKHARSLKRKKKHWSNITEYAPSFSWPQSAVFCASFLKFTNAHKT